LLIIQKFKIKIIQLNRFLNQVTTPPFFSYICVCLVSSAGNIDKTFFLGELLMNLASNTVRGLAGSTSTTIVLN
jgi:hypothetical protein